MTTQGSRIRVLVITVASAAVALGGWWWLGGGAGGERVPDPGAAARTQPSGQSHWGASWTSAGFKGPRALRPDHADAGLRAGAKAMAQPSELLARWRGWRASGLVKDVDPQRPRVDAVLNASELYAALAKGSARRVHSVESAWLLQTLCRALGAEPKVFRSRGPDRLVLSDLKVSVTCNGKPLSSGREGSSSDTAVSEAQLAGWWLLLRAQVARSSDQFTQAHQDIALAERLLGDSKAATFERGVLQIVQGLNDRGIETCESAIAAQEDPMARLFLADVLAAMEQPFKAYRHAQEVVKRHPELAQGHVALALLDAGRVQSLPDKDKAPTAKRAREGFQRALKLDPKVAGARAGLAQLALVLGQPQEAEGLLKEGVSQHQDRHAALVLVELLLNQERADEAVATLAKMDRAGDEQLAAAWVKSKALAGDVDEAKRAAVEAVKEFPRSATIALMLADLLRQLGETDAAVAALEPHRTGRRKEEITGLQVQLLLQAGKYPKALALLEPMLKVDKPSREVGLLGVIAYGLANKGESRQKLVTRLVDRSVATWAQIVGVLIEAGDAKGAELVLTQGLGALPAGDKRWKELALTQVMLMTASGRKSQAVALRDTLATQLTDPASKPPFIAACDEAIKGAEAELATMAQEAEAKEETPSP